MPVDYVPGFWDMFGQAAQRGISLGVDQYNRERDRKREDEQRKQALAMQQFAAMLQAYQSGGAPNTALNQAAQNAGMGGVNFMPSSAQVRNNIMSAQGQDVQLPQFMPTGGMSGMPTSVKMPQVLGTDDQRSFAGLPTQDEIATRRAAGVKANDFLSATPEVRQAAAGLKSPTDLALADAAELSKYGATAGERYVMSALSNPKLAGRIDPRRMDALVDEAFKDFTANDATAKQLTPEQLTSVRSAFGQAATNRYVAQKNEDAIAAYRDALGSARLMGAGMQQQGKFMSALQSTANADDAAVKAFESNNKSMMPLINGIVTLKADNPLSQGIMELQRRYQALQQAASSSKQLWTQYTTGAIPDDQVQSYLHQRMQLLQGQQGGEKPDDESKPVNTELVKQLSARARAMKMNDEEARDWIRLRVKAGMSKKDATALAEAIGLKGGIY